MSRKKDGGCNDSCECSRRLSRRDFLKITAVASFVAGCSSTGVPIGTADETTDVSTSVGGASATPVSAPTDETVVTPASTATDQATATPALDLTGKKAIYILPSQVYAPVCHAGSRDVLSRGGASLSFASWTLEEISPWVRGYKSLKPDMLVSDVNVADFDVIIFECGQPMDENDPDALRIAQEANEQGKVLAAVCMMPAILANAGVLDGKRAACNADNASFLEEKGAILADAEAERDGNVVTASFNGHIQFGELIAEALAELV